MKKEVKASMKVNNTIKIFPLNGQPSSSDVSTKMNSINQKVNKIGGIRRLYSNLKPPSSKKTLDDETSRGFIKRTTTEMH